MVDSELSKQLGKLFESNNPINLLVKENGGRLAVSPHAAINLLSDSQNIVEKPVIAFVRSKKAETELLELKFGEDKLVGFVPSEEDSLPITLSDGRLLGVMTLSTLYGLLNKEDAKQVVEEREEVTKVKEKRKKLLPQSIQEISHALSVQAPILGDLEIRSNWLSRRLYTIHQVGVENNGLTSVSMYKVDKYKSSRGGGVTKSRSTRHVVGFYLPTKAELDDPKLLVKVVDELKLKLARKKHKSGTVASFDMEGEIDISVVSEEQLKVWRKANFFTELRAYKENAAPLDKVYSLIQKQLGKDVQIQVQHITNGEADLVFVPQNARSPSELSAFDVIVNGKGNQIKKVERVVGIMCVPDNMSERDKQSLAKKVSKSLRLLYTSKSFAGKMPNILAVDKNLFNFWQERAKNNEVIFEQHTKSEAALGLPNQEKSEKVGVSGVRSIDFYSYEPNKPGIGARFMQLIVKYGDGHEERLTLDHGAQFENFPWDGISTPSFATGMEAYLPYLPPDQVKFWRRTLELRQAAERGASFFVPENAIARDLAHRIGLEEFTRLAAIKGVANAEEVIPVQFGNIEVPNVHHLGVVYTHGHVDHFGWGGLLSTNIPVITADASLPFFETIFLAGSGGFAKEAIFRRERDTMMTKASRRIYTPPLYLPEPYQEIRLGRGQVGVTLLPVSHSIYGAVMTKVTIYNQADEPIKTIVYTGDFNFDNRAMMDETEKHLQDTDILITDTTNIRPNAYNKPSVGVTRGIMEEGFREALVQADKSSIIELAWHNLADVHLIQQIAAEVGQNVYVYPKMAILLHLIHQLDETRQRNVQSYNWREHNPVSRLGAGGVSPWIKPKMTFKKGERMLMESMDVATHASLANAGQHVLLVPPNPMLEDTMLGADTSQYEQAIRAHYWPYGLYDKKIVRENLRFVRSKGLRYLTDLDLSGGYIRPSTTPKYHMSGHARPEDTLALVNRLASQGKLKQVIPIHGDARSYAAQEIRKQNQNIVVYDRFKKNGFSINLHSQE